MYQVQKKLEIPTASEGDKRLGITTIIRWQDMGEKTDDLSEATRILDYFIRIGPHSSYRLVQILKEV